MHINITKHTTTSSQHTWRSTYGTIYRTLRLLIRPVLKLNTNSVNARRLGNTDQGRFVIIWQTLLGPGAYTNTIALLLQA